MSPKTKIPLRDFLADFQVGMTDTELIDKYQISPNQLRSLFKRLLDRQIIDPIAFEAWQIFGNSDVPLDIRKYPRIVLESQPRIHEVANPGNRGIVVNVSLHGLAVRGLRARFDEMMTLVVPWSEVTPFGPILIDARCRWLETSEGCENPVCGFYVVVVGGTNWESVCQLFASCGKARS